MQHFKFKSITLFFKAADTPYFKQCLQQAVKRMVSELADEQRVRGAGPKPMMGEEDERWLAKCIGVR